MKKRLILTAILLALLILLSWIWGAFRGPLEGAAAVGQLTDDTTTYVASRAMAEGLIGKVLFLVLLCGLVVIWFTQLKEGAVKLAAKIRGRRRNLK